jgi:hypothetical protein
LGKTNIKGISEKNLMVLDLMALINGEAEREMSNLGTDLKHKAQILCDVIVYVKRERCAKR